MLTHQRLGTLPAAALLMSCTLGGCARANVYQQWDRTLRDALVGRPAHYTKADVSMLLGGTPARCENIESTTPSVGIIFDTKARIIGVAPGSPADSVGLRRGLVVISVAGEPTPTNLALRQVLNARLKVGVPLIVNTDQGRFVPVPRLATEEQCYWEVSAGDVRGSGAGLAYVPGVGATGRARSAAYTRYYRLTGRFFNSILARAASNWQY